MRVKELVYFNVSNSMPKQNVRLIVSAYEHGNRFEFCAYYTEHGFVDENEMMWDTVTHWAYIPSPF